MATESIGKTVYLNNKTAKKMAEILAKPQKPLTKRPDSPIHEGRIKTKK